MEADVKADEWDELEELLAKDDPPVLQHRLNRMLKAKIVGQAEELRRIRQGWKFRGAPPSHHSSAQQLRQGIRTDHRAMLLAYGFLRGKPYRTIESEDTVVRPNWSLVDSYLYDYCADASTVWRQRFAEWLDAANLSDGIKP